MKLLIHFLLFNILRRATEKIKRKGNDYVTSTDDLQFLTSHNSGKKIRGKRKGSEVEDCRKPEAMINNFQLRFILSSTRIKR